MTGAATEHGTDGRTIDDLMDDHGRAAVRRAQPARTGSHPGAQGTTRRMGAGQVEWMARATVQVPRSVDRSPRQGIARLLLHRQHLLSFVTVRTEMTPIDTLPADEIVDEVRARYAQAARAVLDRSPEPSEAAASCCSTSGQEVFGSIGYDELDRASLPDAAVLASLGCGNPTAVAELKEGETVLDLGSGGGIDVL